MPSVEDSVVNSLPFPYFAKRIQDVAPLPVAGDLKTYILTYILGTKFHEMSAKVEWSVGIMGNSLTN